MKKVSGFFFTIGVLALILVPGVSLAEQFRIAIM